MSLISFSHEPAVGAAAGAHFAMCMSDREPRDAGTCAQVFGGALALIGILFCALAGALALDLSPSSENPFKYARVRVPVYTPIASRDWTITALRFTSALVTEFLCELQRAPPAAA